jgi:S1-C subfamily serine protease
MANLDSPSYANNRPLRGPGIGGTRGGVALASVTIPASATTADVLRIARLPADARVIGGWAKNDGATSITFNVGDAGLATRFFSATTLAAGAWVAMSNPAGFNATFTTKTDIVGALTANATGAAVLTLYLHYLCEEPV